MIVLIPGTFILLCLLTFIKVENREKLFCKTFHAWTLDLSGLLIQGTFIPFLQVTLIAGLARFLFPSWSGQIEMQAIFAFLLNFVGIDYLYYWNHRLLHAKLWPFHRVHHSVKTFDVLATSRNSVWSSFFIVYLWINGLFLYLLKDPTAYAFGMALTASLDLWRHSPVGKTSINFQRFLSQYLFLITPAEHAVHHTRKARTNFGANLNLFDKIHGTHEAAKKFDWDHLGIATNLDLKGDLFFPWRKSKGEK